MVALVEEAPAVAQREREPGRSAPPHGVVHATTEGGTPERARASAWRSRFARPANRRNDAARATGRRAEVDAVSQGFDPYENQRAAVGGGARCPHCGAVAESRADEELWRVCRICGGPRIDLPAGVALPTSGADTLRKAEQLRRGRAASRALAVGAGIGAAAGLLLGLLVSFFGLSWGVLTLLVVAGPTLATALVARSKAESRSVDLRAALDAAWSAAAQAVARANLATTPAELAEALSIPAERAAELHTMLAVDAELGSLGGSADSAQLRIAPVPVDPRFQALEEAALAEAEAEADAALAHTERAPGRKLGP